jgi:peptide/nickel transport system permease protein
VLLRYLVQRLLSSVLVVALVSVLIFLVLHLLPGDPAVVILGAEATPEALAALRVQLGLDRPLIEQYLGWLGGVLGGDLGTSLIQKKPIGELIADRVPTTALLTALAMVMGLLIAIPAGVVAAVRRNSPVDRLVSLVTVAGIATPSFWLGVLLILFFSVQLPLFPPGGYVSPLEDPLEGLRRMILPSTALGVALAASLTRMTRSSMLEVLQLEFIRTAAAKGLARETVITRHALRNALIPTVTTVGLQVSTLIGGALIVEEIFSLPGIGRLIVHGVYDRDFPLVQSAIFVVVIVLTAVNVIIDFTYAYLDPRIRFGR